MPIDTANARKVKLPDFMSSDPTTWVNLCEAVFVSHGGTDLNNKYNVMVVALPVQVLGKAKDIINALYDASKYSNLTGKLKQLFRGMSYSQWAAMHAVPALQNNQRPSHLLSVLHSCLQGLYTRDIWMLLSLFLSKLPTMHC